jgi:hypothetical protein
VAGDNASRGCLRMWPEVNGRAPVIHRIKVTVGKAVLPTLGKPANLGGVVETAGFPHQMWRERFRQRQLLNEVADTRDKLRGLPDRCEISDQCIEARCSTARGQKAKTVHQALRSDEITGGRAGNDPAQWRRNGVQQTDVPVPKRVSETYQRSGRRLFKQFDQMPIACLRQHAHPQMTERPLKTERAAAEDGIQNCCPRATDDEPCELRVNVARPMRQSERDQMQAPPAEREQRRIERAIGFEHGGERLGGPA